MATFKLYVGIDLETTDLCGPTVGRMFAANGYLLKQQLGDILEISLLLVDKNLIDVNMIDGTNYITRQIKPTGVDSGTASSDEAIEMNKESGVYQLALEHGLDKADVDSELAALLDGIKTKILEENPEYDKVLLEPFNNNVKFDLGWLDCHLPKLSEMLSFRAVDVSSNNEQLRDLIPDFSRAVEKEFTHKSIIDIKETLCEFKMQRMIMRLGVDKYIKMKLPIPKLTNGELPPEIERLYREAITE